MALLITLMKNCTFSFYEVLVVSFKEMIFVNVFSPWMRHFLWFTKLMMTVFVNIWRFFRILNYITGRYGLLPPLCVDAHLERPQLRCFTVLVRFGNFRVFWCTENCGKPPWKREKTCWYTLWLYSQDDFRDQKITLFAWYLISCNTIDKQ